MNRFDDIKNLNQYEGITAALRDVAIELFPEPKYSPAKSGLAERKAGTWKIGAWYTYPATVINFITVYTLFSWFEVRITLKDGNITYMVNHAYVDLEFNDYTELKEFIHTKGEEFMKMIDETMISKDTVHGEFLFDEGVHCHSNYKEEQSIVISNFVTEATLLQV